MKNLVYVAIISWIAFLACNTDTSQSKVPITMQSDSVKIDSITQLINKNPRKASLYAERSKLMMDKGLMNKAIIDLVIANQIDSLNPEYYLNLSDFYLRIGKSEVVNDILQKGNKLIPENKDILYRLGNLNLYIQDYKKANEYLNKALEIDRYFAEAYFSKGLLYNETGNKDKAIENFQFAVEREPEYYDGYIQLALLYAEKSDSLALDYYDNALRIIPASYEALYGKAYFYQEIEQLENAIKSYNYILENIEGVFPEVYFNLGYINMLFYADYMEAIKQFESATIAEPQFFEAWYNVGYCYEQIGNKVEASKNYKKSLEIKPNYDLAIKGLNRLE